MQYMLPIRGVSTYQLLLTETITRLDVNIASDDCLPENI